MLLQTKITQREHHHPPNLNHISIDLGNKSGAYINRLTLVIDYVNFVRIIDYANWTGFFVCCLRDVFGIGREANLLPVIIYLSFS